MKNTAVFCILMVHGCIIASSCGESGGIDYDTEFRPYRINRCTSHKLGIVAIGSSTLHKKQAYLLMLEGN